MDDKEEKSKNTDTSKASAKPDETMKNLKTLEGKNREHSYLFYCRTNRSLNY